MQKSWPHPDTVPGNDHIIDGASYVWESATREELESEIRALCIKYNNLKYDKVIIPRLLSRENSRQAFLYGIIIALISCLIGFASTYIGILLR